MNERKIKLHYEGSLFWPIFWLIIFFPLAFVLLLINSSLELGNTIYRYRYDGTRFWLYFWTVIFFPIMLVLLFLNGSALEITKS